MRVAVIGLGSMGKNHVRVYDELPEAELVAVVDSDPNLAKTVAGKHGIPAYSDFTEMLKKENPEAVSIAVPTALHFQVGMGVLDAGVHVLMEKPIAATIDQGRGLIEKARSVDRQLMVGHIVRYNPAIQALKEKLTRGDLGRIFQVVCRRAGPFPSRIRDVGVVVDLAPHDVDIMRFLIGSNPIRVYAETERRIHTDHEDLLWGLLRFPDGVIGALEINWLTPTKIREVLVLGERGLFRVDDLTQDLYFYENAQAIDIQWSTLAALKGVSEGSMIRYPLQHVEPLRAELQAFVRAIDAKTAVPVSGEDGLQALQLALALVESGQKHMVMDV